jgi:Tol biopolymer transport system component
MVVTAIVESGVSGCIKIRIRISRRPKLSEVTILGQDFLNHQPVEGTLLSSELAKGPPAADRALDYAIKLGMALHQAHMRGLVHGGIAPKTIAITAEGISILTPPAEGDAELAAYRSPEQVLGKPIDWRTDNFAYGAVLYEMVCGRRAFAGEGRELDQAIISGPPPSVLAKSPVHAAMEGVIAACLDRDILRRRQRLQNAVTELKLAGRWLPRMMAATGTPRPETITAKSAGARATGPRVAMAPAGTGWRGQASTLPPVIMPGHPWRRRALLFGIALLIVFVIALPAALYLSRRPADVSSPVALTISPPDNSSYPGSPSVSPDGRYLVSSAAGPDGRRMLWLRALDEIHPRIIPGTDGAAAPFWSPDSQVVGFFAKQSLKTWRVHMTDGRPDGPILTLCAAQDSPGGAAWSPDGVILFSPGLTDGLYEIRATGGKPQPVLQPDVSHQERAYRWPQFLPDGKHFLFFVLDDMTEATGIYVGSLGVGQAERVMTSETSAVYAPVGAKSGYLLFVQNTDLKAQAFDFGNLKAIGQPRVIAAGIGAVQSLALAPLSVSNNGVLAYQSVGVAHRRLWWVDRTGQQVTAVGEPGDWGPPRISPDGKSAMVGKLTADGTHAHLWLLGEGGEPTQFTFSDTSEGQPVWAPDGSRVAFWQEHDQAYDIYTKAVRGPGKEELLVHSQWTKYPTDWSHNGKFLIFGVMMEGTRSDIWAYAFAGRKTGAVRQTVYQEGYATLSADDKWLAYQSDETGHNQVWVEHFEGIDASTRRRWQISTNGGGLPHWRGDGRELYYMTSDGDMMVAPVDPGGDSFQAGRPRLLFHSARPLPGTPWNLYDVSSDGQRFLVNIPFELSAVAPIEVLTNWTQKLTGSM